MSCPERRVIDIDRRSGDNSQWQRAQLPDDVQQDAAKRLAALCGIGAAIWMIEVVMANALRPASVPTAFPWPGNLIGGVMIAALTASAFYVGHRVTHASCAMLD